MFNWFAVAYITNESFLWLFGGRGFAYTLSKMDTFDETVLKIFNRFGIEELKSPTGNQASFKSPYIYIACIAYAAKYVILLARLVVKPLYNMQHGFILFTLLQIRVVWNNLRIQMDQPLLSFEKVF